MARKRRTPPPPPLPPPPPPPPPQQESDTDAGESPPRIVLHGASDREHASDVDVHAFQMRPVSRPESEADESSESEPEVPEPVQKKAAATTKNSKAPVPEDKKRAAPKPAPSGRAKRAKAEAGKANPPGKKGKKANAEQEKEAALEATPAAKGKEANAVPVKAAALEPASAGKGKKANAEREKEKEVTPAAKGKKKTKKPAGKQDDPGLDPSLPSESARTKHKWSEEDLIKILEALALHVKAQGTLPKTNDLIAAVHDRLDRKDCSYNDMYEKVRGLRDHYLKLVKKCVVPTGEVELRMYNLSEAIWAKDKEAMAAADASQNDPTVTKSEKGQAKKKLDVSSKAGTVSEVPNQKESNEGHAAEVETGKDVKGKLSKEETTAVSPRKSKRLANGKQTSGTDAKSGTPKETATTDTENGDDIAKRKQDEMDIDLMPKEVSTDTQNHGAQTEEGTHQEEAEIGANVPGHRSFDELQGLYPCLAGCLERIEAEHPCGETLKRAFGYIGNEKANALESRIKGLAILEMKEQARRQGLHNEVLKSFLR